MPKYDFSCTKCEVVWDVFVPLKDFEVPLKCPDCGETLKRVISTPYFKVN